MPAPSARGTVNRAYCALIRAWKQEQFRNARTPFVCLPAGILADDDTRNDPVDIRRATYVNSSSLLGGRPMVGLQTLDLAIGVRVPASQPLILSSDLTIIVT